MKERGSEPPVPRSDGRGVDVSCPPIGPGGRWLPLAHVLCYGSLATALATVIAGSAGTLPRIALGAAGVAFLASWYTFWLVRHGRRVVTSPAAAALYFGVVGLVCLGLLALDPMFELLLFTVFAQLLGHLPWRAAIAATAGGVVLVHVPLAVSEGGVGLHHLAFGAVGLGVLALVVLSLRAVAEQSARRQRLIEALEAARAELARSERRAGVLEERQRLAGEVHDTLAQAFTSIVMLLEAAQASAGDRAARCVAQALESARAGLNEARRLVWALRPESLEQGGLPAALERATAELASQTGIEARTVVTGEPRPLSADVEVTLLRAAQEALANARRHARARHVTATLSYMDDVVVLDVCDDGEGFDPAALPAAPSPRGGLGLVAMRERVEALSGKLAVESDPGKGSAVVVELPIGAGTP